MHTKLGVLSSLVVWPMRVGAVVFGSGVLSHLGDVWYWSFSYCRSFPVVSLVTAVRFFLT